MVERPAEKETRVGLTWGELWVKGARTGAIVSGCTIAPPTSYRTGTREVTRPALCEVVDDRAGKRERHATGDRPVADNEDLRSIVSTTLTGKKIAFLVANSGVEQVELTTPWQAVEDAGGVPVLVAPEKDTVQAFTNDVEKADTFEADHAVSEVSAADFDGLVLPGGTTNPDALRLDDGAVDLVKQFVAAGKPVAAICHGPWMLVEAGVLQGKTLTSWPSLRTDIRNAGGTWRDVEASTCPAEGFTLVTSRNPDDLPAFSSAAVAAFAGA